jgi:ribonuclease HII
MLDNRKIYENKLEAQLAQWKADLDVLKAKASRASVEAKVKHDELLDSLQGKHDEAAEHLAKLKTATDDVWVQVKTSTEKTWAEVKAFFHSASEKP